MADRILREKVNGGLAGTEGVSGEDAVYDVEIDFDNVQESLTVAETDVLLAWVDGALAKVAVSKVLPQPLGATDTPTFAGVRVDTGSIGIGTDAPAQVLDVIGNAQLTGSLYFNNTSGNGIWMKRSDGSQVSILSVVPSASGHILANATVVRSVGGNPIQLLPNNGTVNGLTVLSAGMVGIGTINPAVELDVSGSLRSTGFSYIGDGTNYRSIFLDARAGGNFLTDATKRIGEVSNAFIDNANRFVIKALNSYSLYLVNASNDGIRIASSGSIVASGGLFTFGSAGSASAFATADGDLDVRGKVHAQGGIRAAYNSGDGSAGVTGSVVVYDANLASDVTLAFKDGILTTLTVEV